MARLRREGLATVLGSRTRIRALKLHAVTVRAKRPESRLDHTPTLKKMVMHGRRDPGVNALLAPSPGRSAHWWVKSVWRGGRIAVMNQDQVDIMRALHSQEPIAVTVRSSRCLINENGNSAQLYVNDLLDVKMTLYSWEQQGEHFKLTGCVTRVDVALPSGSPPDWLTKSRVLPEV